MQVDLTELSIDDLTSRALESVRAAVETGGATLSSETPFVSYSHGNSAVYWNIRLS